MIRYEFLIIYSSVKLLFLISLIMYNYSIMYQKQYISLRLLIIKYYNPTKVYFNVNKKSIITRSYILKKEQIRQNMCRSVRN